MITTAQAQTSEHYWCDNETFCYWLHKWKDEEGDPFDILAEYHKDEDRFVFIKVYEYDQMTLTEDKMDQTERENIINNMKKWMEE